MKKRMCIIFIFIICLMGGAQASKVQGTLYLWSDFEKPLKGAIVEVNSTPVQSKVALEGVYSFDLPRGDYLITAKYYRNNVLEYSAEEAILIETEGNFTIDLLLFPPTDSEFEFLGDINLTDIDLKNGGKTYDYAILFLILVPGLIILYWFMKKRRKTMGTNKGQHERTGEPEQRELPEDLNYLLDLLMKSGGRATQKDLRKKLSYSEAKVSLMIADLEERGLIRKIKKGRSNIIIIQK